MVGALLLRGMLVGLFAGLLAFGFARVFGEPSVDRAIAFEAQHEHAHEQGHEHAHEHTHDHGVGAQPAAAAEPELVSRETQAGPGLFTGMVVFGTALGGLFALVFAFAYGRIGQLDARATAALIALIGFVAVVLAPGLKYPANPPAVGQADTIGYRTALFFVMLAISLAASFGAVLLARRLWARLGPWAATLVAAASFVVVVAVVQALMPSVNEVPREFSASVLWDFRVAALGIQVVLWTTLGLAFGALAQRSLGHRPAGRLGR